MATYQKTTARQRKGPRLFWKPEGIALRVQARRHMLLQAARQAWLESDGNPALLARITHLGGGMFWWPELAPLTTMERRTVRESLGLLTRA